MMKNESNFNSLSNVVFFDGNLLQNIGNKKSTNDALRIKKASGSQESGSRRLNGKPPINQQLTKSVPYGIIYKNGERNHDEATLNNEEEKEQNNPNILIKEEGKKKHFKRKSQNVQIKGIPLPNSGSSNKIHIPLQQNNFAFNFRSRSLTDEAQPYISSKESSCIQRNKLCQDIQRSFSSAAIVSSGRVMSKESSMIKDSVQQEPAGQKDRLFLSSSITSMLNYGEALTKQKKKKSNSSKNGSQNVTAKNKSLTSEQMSKKSYDQKQKNKSSTLEKNLQEQFNLNQRLKSREDYLLHEKKASPNFKKESLADGEVNIIQLGGEDRSWDQQMMNHGHDENLYQNSLLEDQNQVSQELSQLSQNNSLSIIKKNVTKQNHGPNINEFDMSQSLLFTARINNLGFKQSLQGLKDQENLEILTVLELAKLHKGAKNDPLITSEMLYLHQSQLQLNTQILFQDHLPNNFYYHERQFTHRNINQYFFNGMICVPLIPSHQDAGAQLNTGMIEAIHPDGTDKSASIFRYGLALDCKPSVQSNNNVIILGNEDKSGLGVSPRIFSKAGTNAKNYQSSNVSPVALGAGGTRQIIVGSTNVGTLSSVAMNTFSKKTQEKQTKQGPMPSNFFQQPEISFESDNTDLNDEFDIPVGYSQTQQNVALSSQEESCIIIDFSQDDGELPQVHLAGASASLLQPHLSPQHRNSLLPHNQKPSSPLFLRTCSANQHSNQNHLGSPSFKSKISIRSNCNDSSQMSGNDISLSTRVQDAIRTAPPFSVIKLPSHSHIVLNGFTIKHPLTISGRPGTIIEIQNGNILVDFREFLKANPQFQQSEEAGKEFKNPVKAILSEMSLIFKFEMAIMADKVRHLANGGKRTNEQENNNRSTFSPIRLQTGKSLTNATNQNNRDTEQGLSYVKFSSESPNTLIMPMIIVEEQSTLEIRDCYLRSIRKDSPQYQAKQQKGEYENLEEAMMLVKNQIECEEIGVLVEPSGWQIGRDLRERMSPQILKDFDKVQRGQALLRSCIFFNFFEQCRIGIDASCLLEKCHLSESRNNSIHALNPRALKIIGCNFSKPNKHCVLTEWLPNSTRTEKCRNLVIDGCDMYSSNGSSIVIQPQKDATDSGIPQFCAHNLKIVIQNNRITRTKSEGLVIINIAITSLYILKNDFVQNNLHNIYIKQVHQKSNKCSEDYFLMKENKFIQSERGAGCYIVDCGMTYSNCLFKGNRQGGLIIQGYTPTKNKLQSSLSQLDTNKLKYRQASDPEEKLRQFINKFPMSTVVINCEFNVNYSHGCWIDEHWKGPVIFKNCKFLFNHESGITLKAEKVPKLYEFSEIKLARKEHKLPRPLQKSNQIAPLQNQKQTKKQFMHPFSNISPGTVQVIECEFTENKYNGIVLSHVQTLVKYCTFINNAGYAIRVHSVEHQPLLKLDYICEKDFKRSVNGYIGGPWGILSYNELCPQKNQSSGLLFGCCIPQRISLKQQNASATLNTHHSPQTQANQNQQRLPTDNDTRQSANSPQKAYHKQAPNPNFLSTPNPNSLQQHRKGSPQQRQSPQKRGGGLLWQNPGTQSSQNSSSAAGGGGQQQTAKRKKFFFF